MLEADKKPTWNPLRLTAGISGSASLSNLQFFAFSLLVAGMLLYALLRIGVLLDISQNVAWLIGIVGSGSAAARLVARTRERISPHNLAWLRDKGWLPIRAELSDLILADNELAIDRVQALVFGLVIFVAMLVRGPYELATFTIPEGLLGILAASQAIYVGGKWVRQDKPEEAEKARVELDKAVETLRIRWEQVEKTHAGVDNETRLRAFKEVPADYEAYIEEARKTVQLLVERLGIERPKKGVFDVGLDEVEPPTNPSGGAADTPVPTPTPS